MQRFLESCASYIYDRYNGDFTNLCIVFPNRRAGVFFTAYLQKLLQKSVLGPDVFTINELMQSLSPLAVADKLLLIARLYGVFREVTGSKETFDDFYFWGEVLLADFDDIDKYRVNAADLFRNIADIKDIENQFDYLSAAQKEILEKFWGSLKNWEEWDHEKDFVTFWGKLFTVYSRLREQLQQDGAAYSGMAIRDGIDNLDESITNLKHEKYLFIGLNALNSCEKALLKRLNATGRAQFFWDYDKWFVDNPVNDAGNFIRRNLAEFPAPFDFMPDTNAFSRPKQIEIVAVPSGHGQSQVIPEFMQQIEQEIIATGQETKHNNFDRTAIVLADESLLFPVLGALPPEIENINVTMGYPVKNSTVAGFLQLLAALLRNSSVNPDKPVRLYFRLVSQILQHQLLTGVEPEKVNEKLAEIVAGNMVYVQPEELFLSPVHQVLFSLPGKVEEYPAYFLNVTGQIYSLVGKNTEGLLLRELIYHIYLAIEKLQIAIKEATAPEGVTLSPAIFFRLFNQYLSQVSVPFEGEPLTGLQVMGVLETRCLDFDNLMIVGLNEELWPRSGSTATLIPYNLRKGFGIPGLDDQDAIYSYYFYRLLQCAKRVTATWNTIREGTSGGELSRYGFQLKMVSPHKVISRNHDYPFINQPVAPITVQSGSNISARLLKMNADGRLLSPSAINTWLSCRLKFYFRYVLQIEEPDEVAEEIDRRLFGNIFHKAVEILYKPLVGKTIDKAAFEMLKKDNVKLESCIRHAFATEYFNKPAGFAGQVVFEGKSLLIFSTIRSYLINLLEIDSRNAPLSIHHLEGTFEAPVGININGKPEVICVGGKIDRVDEVDGAIRVIDYKTGSLDSRDLACTELSSLTDPDQKKLKKEIVQALIYGLVLRKSYFAKKKVTATVYAILKLSGQSFDPDIRLGKTPVKMSMIETEWEDLLKEVLEQIYSPDTLFSQTQYKERCTYCPYKAICFR